MAEELKGNGPSRTAVVDCGGKGLQAVLKTFPESEHQRMVREVEKLRYFRYLGKATGAFDVPEIYEVQDRSYLMEYITSAVPLESRLAAVGVGAMEDWSTRILAVLSTVTCPSVGTPPTWPCDADLWTTMLGKFGAAATRDVHEELAAAYCVEVTRLPPAVEGLPLGYSHGDLTLDNTIYSPYLPERVFLIDAVWSAVESPVWDVGKLLQSTAANWGGIKATGSIVPKPKWLAALNECIVDQLPYRASHALLGCACQLARVSRWAHPVPMVTLATRLLKTYNDCGGNDAECGRALRGLV